MQKSKFILTLFLLFVVRIFLAQVTICIPTNPVNAIPTDTVSMPTAIQQTEERKPLGTYFGYERTAIRFSQGEIGMFGQISAIAVFCDSIHAPGNTPLNIYVKEITDSAFLTASTVTTETTGATLVYAGTLSASTFVKNTWINIPFTSPFTHATSKPVEFIFETNAGGSGSDPVNGKFFAHYHPHPDYYTTQFWNADNNPPTTTGGLSGYRVNVQITINTIPNCSGMPNAGTTISTADTLCMNEVVSLSLQGNTAATGLSYQWQESFDGTNFINISSATSDVLSTPLIATTWYRCAVTCSGQTAYSTVKEVALQNFMKCYCNTNLGGGCSGGTAIDSVAIEGTALANGLSGCSANNYSLYPTSGSTTATLNQQSSYVLDTRFNGNVVASFWIDFNRNGILENTEWKQICLQSPATNTDSLFKTSFNVPANAGIGLTLMRIRTRASGDANDTATVCASFGSGETEDYYVYIDYAVGIKQFSVSTEQLSIYPNPTNSTLQVSIKNYQNAIYSVQIINMIGETVKQLSINNKQSTIDVSDLINGVYFLRVGNSTQKFIKQ